MDWTGPLIVVLVLIGLAALLVRLSVRVVGIQRAAVVERFGRYRRTLQPGLHLLIPVAERVRAMPDLQEQTLNLSIEAFVTDGTVRIDSTVWYRITDPVAAVYEISNLSTAIKVLLATALRNIVAELDAHQALTSPAQLAEQARLWLVRQPHFETWSRSCWLEAAV